MKSIAIGKNALNDYVVNDDTVSRHHALLTVSDSGEVTIKDLNSLNGTFVDGKRITRTTKLLPNQVVRVGETTIDWQRMIAVPQKAKPVEFQPKDAVEVRRLGKETDNDILYANPDVSRHHALLCKKKDGSVSIVDCDSTNGTFVNGQRISGEKVLQSGDQVMIANKYPLKWDVVFSKSRSKTKTWLVVVGIIAAIALVFRFRRRLTRTLIVSLAAAIAVIVGLMLFITKGKTKQVVEVSTLQPSEIYAMYKNSVVLIQQESGFRVTANGEPYGIYSIDGGSVAKGKSVAYGSGFFISDDGKIMTNRHVVAYTEKEMETVKQYVYDKLISKADVYDEKGNIKEAKAYREMANHLEVTFEENTSIILNDTYVKSESEWIPCTIIKFSKDEKLDAAIIQLNSKKLPETVKKIVDLNDIAHKEDMEVGDKLYTLGFPEALDYGQTDSGIQAHGEPGLITQEQSEYTYGHNIPTQHGASGSPIFDCHGRFAGIIVSGYGISFEDVDIFTGYNRAVSPQKAAEFAK